MIIKNKNLKLIFTVSLAISVLIPLVSISYINPLFVQTLAKNTENVAVRLGSHITSRYFAGISELTRSSLPDNFAYEAPKLIHDFNLIKLKIFSSTGENIYSSSPADIGKINDAEYFHTIVARGKPFTKLVKKDTKSLEGQRVTSDVVETYVPIMSGDRFVGAFELYYDVTETNKELTSIVILSSIISLGLMLVFLLLIITILVNSDKTVLRSLAGDKGSKIKSPLNSLIVVTICILGAELAIMVLLSYIPTISIITEAFLDSIMLVMLISPTLYFFLVRPMILRINQLRMAEGKLHFFNERLKQSNQELQDFAYIASHDLQEPLRKVTAFGDRLKSKYAEILGEQGSDYVERMLNATRRMRTFIDDLLQFSRVTTKAQPLEPVHLGKVAGEVVSDLEVRIEQTGGTVEVDNLPTIEADRLQMRQLMQNLIGNALKFSKKDTPPVVKISGCCIHGNGGSPGSVGSTDEYCRLIVEDNGIGFDEQYTDHIFGAFQRLHGRGEYEGSGIGLSVCKKIVERHGGSITTKSAPGQGATFIITLPVSQSKGGEVEWKLTTNK